MTVYQLLEDHGDGYRLSPEPVQLWQLLTLEITVLDVHGPSLLLRMPYYPDPTAGAEFIGAWAPPFIGVPISTRYDLPATAGDLRRRYEDAESSLDARELVEQMVYEMGIDNPNITERRGFTEIKSSPRTPHVVKAYRIRRFAVVSMLPRSLSNIADSEGRKGHVFLPLQNTDRYLRSVTLPSGATQRTYLGLPLMTNVATVVQNAAMREELCSSALPVSRSYFFREETGWILALDMAGYGRANQVLESHGLNVKDTGDQLATFLRVSLAEAFAVFLARIGCRLVQHVGDGFVAAIPDKEVDSADPRSFSARILEAVSELYASTKAFNDRMPQEVRLGSRLAIHRGAFRYGRVGGSLSPEPGFDGSEIVNVCRIEAGLAALAKEYTDQVPEVLGVEIATVAQLNLVAVSESAGEFVEINPNWYLMRGSAELASKEFIGRANVYAYAPWLRSEASSVVDG